MSSAPAGSGDGRESFDVVVAGSGAAGLVAAVTARVRGLSVLVVEKEPWIGGTSAVSGGWFWVPGNSLGAKVGIDDNVDDALLYLRSEAGPFFDERLATAFLAAGPAMIEFLLEQGIEMIPGPTFSDYHSDAPGARPGGRSVCAAPFDGATLGPDIKRLRRPLWVNTLFGMMIGSGKELFHFFNMRRSVKSAGIVSVILARYAADLARHGRGMRLTNGNALVGRLLALATRLQIEIRTSTRVVELVSDNGAIRGVRVATEGRESLIAASRGVILATGGFARDDTRRAALYPHVGRGLRHVSAAPSGSGDGVSLAEAAGGRQVTELANPAAWTPVSLVPHRSGVPGVFPHFVDRAKPGVIAVDPTGRRFVNEADSYHDFVLAMLQTKEITAETPHAWLLADHRTIRRYGLGYVKPVPVPLSAALRSGYLVRGRTIGDLAARLGIDAKVLADTVERYNEGARNGTDREFGRGESAYNRSLGDPSHKPNPCVAPLEAAPFYAVKVWPGDVGTFAGIACDARARVLDADGQPIAGLFAVGNDMVSPFGGAYPGGGATLGPAMTFGFIAGQVVAGNQVLPEAVLAGAGCS